MLANARTISGSIKKPGQFLRVIETAPAVFIRGKLIENLNLAGLRSQVLLEQPAKKGEVPKHCQSKTETGHLAPFGGQIPTDLREDFGEWSSSARQRRPPSTFCKGSPSWHKSFGSRHKNHVFG